MSVPSALDALASRLRFDCLVPHIPEEEPEDLAATQVVFDNKQCSFRSYLLVESRMNPNWFSAALLLRRDLGARTMPLLWNLELERLQRVDLANHQRAVAQKCNLRSE